MSDRLPGLPPYDAPPLESQLTSLLLFGTPDIWFNRMCSLNDAVIKTIEDWGTTIQSKINGLSEWDAAIIGGIIGLGMGGPLGAVTGGVAGAALIGTVKNWLNGKLGDLMRTLWDAHKKLVDAMQACVDAIFGNPEKLMGLGAGYQQAKASLNNASHDVHTASNDVAIYWQGRGHTAYAGAAGVQQGAMDAMSEKMSSAGHLMADAAEMIQKCWSDIIQALIALGADVLNTLVGDVNITDLPTYTVTKPAGLIADAMNFLNAVVKAIRDVNISARNSGVMNWAELSSGDKALKNGQWPVPSLMESKTYGGNGNWNTTDR